MLAAGCTGFARVRAGLFFHAAASVFDSLLTTQGPVSQAVLSVVLGPWSVRFVGWANWVDCRCFLFFWLCSSALPGVWSFLRVTPTHSGNSAHNHYVNSCMPCCRPHVASTVRPHLRETSLACKARGRRLCLCTGLGHGICTCGLFSKLKGVATLRAWRPPPHGQGLIS